MRIDFYSEVPGESRFSIAYNGAKMASSICRMGNSVTIDLGENSDVPENTILRVFGEALDLEGASGSDKSLAYLKDNTLAGTYRFFLKKDNACLNFYPLSKEHAQKEREIEIIFFENELFENGYKKDELASFKLATKVSLFYKKNKRTIDKLLNKKIKREKFSGYETFQISVARYKTNYTISSLEFDIQDINNTSCTLSLVSVKWKKHIEKADKSIFQK